MIHGENRAPPGPSRRATQLTGRSNISIKHGFVTIRAVTESAKEVGDGGRTGRDHFQAQQRDSIRPIRRRHKETIGEKHLPHLYLISRGGGGAGPAHWRANIPCNALQLGLDFGFRLSSLSLVSLGLAYRISSIEVYIGFSYNADRSRNACGVPRET